MKKLVLIAMMGLLIAGCGAKARESGFWQHDAMYKNWDHLRFSWFGYTNPNSRDAQLSQEQDWWGLEVPYIPAR